MSIVRIDLEGRRNAGHIAIIVVVDLVPIQSHFRSSGHRSSNHCIKTAPRPQAQLKTATGQWDDGHISSKSKSILLSLVASIPRLINSELAPSLRGVEVDWNFVPGYQM